MGLDITIKVYDKNKKFKKDINFDGRNSKWFNNLMGKGCENVYDYLDFYKEYDVEDYMSEKELEWNFGYFRITVEGFRNWVNKYKPYLCAGWVHKYTEWEFRERGIVPNEEFDAYKYFPTEGQVKEDFVWLEWTDNYNNDVWLLNNIKDLEKDDSIIILFDN